MSVFSFLRWSDHHPNPFHSHLFVKLLSILQITQIAEQSASSQSIGHEKVATLWNDDSNTDIVEHFDRIISFGFQFNRQRTEIKFVFNSFSKQMAMAYNNFEWIIFICPCRSDENPSQFHMFETLESLVICLCLSFYDSFYWPSAFFT